jgi:hypothetical protein
MIDLSAMVGKSVYIQFKDPIKLIGAVHNPMDPFWKVTYGPISDPESHGSFITTDSMTGVLGKAKVPSEADSAGYYLLYANPMNANQLIEVHFRGEDVVAVWTIHLPAPEKERFTKEVETSQRPRIREDHPSRTSDHQEEKGAWVKLEGSTQDAPPVGMCEVPSSVLGDS